MAQPVHSTKPTIVLVHGAFADSSSWNEVISRLRADGYPVIAAANPLRSLRSDADAIGALTSSIPGPVVLVGHSYGGAVISSAALGRSNIKALVFVAAFEPDTGESCLELSSRLPGSTLGPALAPPVKTTDGGEDLYIQHNKFSAQFAADVTSVQAELMGITQRPVTSAALAEASGEPAWKQIPSWSIFGTGDLNIPPALMRFMADRAKSRQTVEVAGASHVLMISHAGEVTGLIEAAALAK